MTTHRIVIALTAVNVVLLLGALTQDRPANGPSTPVVRAQVLELVDARGQLRARLNVESNGAVVFRLLDESGTIRVKLGADSAGSGLLLANDATEPGVHLLASSTGSSVKLANKDGRARVIAP